MSHPNWTYDEKSETWFFGTKENGAGVYQDGNRFYANVVVCGTVFLMPFRDSLEESQREAEHQFRLIGGTRKDWQ